MALRRRVAIATSSGAVSRMKPALLLLLLCAAPAWAQTRVQLTQDPDETPWSSDGIAPVTAGSPFTVGNLVCNGFSVATTARTVSSIVDDGAGGSNTYFLVRAETSGAIHDGWIYCAFVERVAS